MLDELLKKLKKSLPPSLQAKLFGGKKSKSKKAKDSEDEDEDEDEDEVETEDTEIEEDAESDNDATEPRVKKPSPKKNSSEDDEEDESEDGEEADENEDEEEESEEELKKKKKQKIVRGAIIAGIVLFVLSELMPGNDELAEAPEVTEEVPFKRPGGVRQAQETTEAAPAENTEVPTQPETESTQELVTTDSPIIEPVPEPTPINEPTITEMPPIETQPEQVPVLESERVVVETKPAPTTLGMQESTSPMEFTEVEEKPVEKPRNLLENIAEELNKKLDYTPPPDYLNSGRGLVYNCKGKHWACVDRESYFQCRSNFRWSQQEKKEPECGVRDVYETLEDCRVIQVHYINMSEPTDFCSL